MRSLRLLALVGPAFLLPALACEDSSSSSGGLFQPEAGPGFEAGPTPTPTPIREAGADTFVPPAPKGVTVTVLDALVPKKDVRVILHDATGAVTSQQQTDAAGKVTIAIAPSMVTVLATASGGGTTPNPVTFFGVADGDKLLVTLASNLVVEQVPVGNFSVTFTSGGVIANANSFYVTAGGSCAMNGGDVAAAVVVPLYPYCLSAQNAVLTSASNAGGLIGYGFAKNVAKPAAGATADVGPLAFTAKGTTTLTATNIPANASPFANLYAIANGASFSGAYDSGSLSTGGVSFSTATGFAEAYQSYVGARPALTAGSESGIVRREMTAAPATATLAFDFATLLPFITAADAATPTPARPDITLTAGAALTPADGGVISMSYVTAAAQGGQWTFVVPSSSASFKVPALPLDAAAFVPASGVQIESVIFVESALIPGYKELKLLPVTPPSGFGVTNTSSLLPTNGTVRVTQWAPLRR